MKTMGKKLFNKREKIILKLNAIYFNLYNDNGYLDYEAKSLVMCYLHFFYAIVKNTIRWRWRKMQYKKLLFIAPTLNNRKSLLPIIKQFSSDDVTMIDDYRSYLPFSRIYWLSLLYIFEFQKLYLKLTKKERIVVRAYFHEFVTTQATYQVIEDVLIKNKQLRIIIFANDHIMTNRCFIENAYKHDIKTIYTQHASVSGIFPSLLFSYSFLDGEESYEKYKKIGNIHGKVFLSGSPRFDILSQIEKISTDAIGIAVNTMDDLTKVSELCNFLSASHFHLIVRPHPSMEGLPIWNEYMEKGYEISFPTQENAFEYVSRIRLLIANESGIHLDSNLARTPSVLFNMSSGPRLDYYSFVKNKLIYACDSKEELLKYIHSTFTINPVIIKYYNAAFGTSHEGKIGILIADFIKSVLENNEDYFINEYFKLDSDGTCYIA